MPICNFEAPNGKPSKLQAGLSQFLGEELATLAWYKMRSIDYLRKTGDWTVLPPPDPSLQIDINKVLSKYSNVREREGFMSEREGMEADLRPLYEKLNRGEPISMEDFPPDNFTVFREFVNSLDLGVDTKLTTDGKPDIVLHGSPKIFSQFKEEFLGSYTSAPSAKQAFFAARDLDTAIKYTEVDRIAMNELGELEGDNPEPDEEAEEYRYIMSLPKDHKLRVQYEEKEAREMADARAAKGKYMHIVWEDRKRDERVTFTNRTNIYPLFFLSQNPLIVDVNHDRKNIGSINETLIRAKAEGYDAVLFKNIRDGAGSTDVYTVFTSGQIVNVIDVINAKFSKNKQKSRLSINLDSNGEPTLESALHVLELGTPAQLEKHLQLAERWKLSRVPGTFNQYSGSMELARKIDKQLSEKSGHLYKDLIILFNKQSKRFEIRPRPKKDDGQLKLFSENPDVLELGKLYATGSNPLAGTDVDNGTYEGQITSLAQHQVFVFGANNKGYHGAGAAAAASGKRMSVPELKSLEGKKMKWVTIGEHSKISEGVEGKSYPLVTVEGKIGGKHKNDRMAEDAIVANIKDLYNTARENTGLEFLVAYTVANKDEKYLSGYTDKELANLFVQAGPIPTNIIFNEDFRKLMENLPGMIIGSEIITEDQSLRGPLQIDQKILEEERAKQMIEIRDAEGKKTGRFFSAAQQEQATDSLIYEISKLIHKTKKTYNAQELNQIISAEYRKLLTRVYQSRAAGIQLTNKGIPVFEHITPEMAAGYARNMEDVVNTFEDLLRDSINRMGVYGIQVRYLDRTTPGETGLDGEFVLEDGKGVERFNELVFSINPQDTASARLKLFMATIEAVEENVIPKPKTISLPFEYKYIEQILSGERKFTVRNAEQLKGIGLNPKGDTRGTIRLEDQVFVVKLVKQLTADEADDYNEGDQRENLEFTKTVNGEEQMAPVHVAAEGDYLLELEPYVQQVGLTFNPSFIGTPMIADFESLYENVTGVLANRKPNFEEYMTVLEAGTPVMRKLAQKLRDPLTSERIRREFVTVMSKTYTQHALVRYKIKKRGVEVRTINANRYSARNMIIENWRQKQKVSKMVTRGPSGIYSMNQKTLAELSKDYDELKALREQYEEAKGRAKTGLQTKYYKVANALLKKMLEYNGIELNELMYDTLRKNHGNMISEWAETATGEPKGLYSAFMLKLLSTKTEEDIEIPLEKSNPLYSENSTLQAIAQAYVAHADVLYNSSHRDMAGNNIWDYSLNKYMSNTFLDLVSSDPTYRNQLKAGVMTRNNWLLKAWETDEAGMKKADLFYLEGLRKMKGKKGAERQNMSDRDQLFTALAMFTNGGYKNAHFMSLTHSDKTTTPVFWNIPRTQTWKGAELSLTALERLYSVFESEYDRIAATAEHTFDSHQQFEKGKGLFYFLPGFNYESMVRLRDAEVITEEELSLMWVDPKTLNAPMKIDKRHKELVVKLLKRFVQKESALMLRRFENFGLVDYAKGKHLFDQQYLDKQMRWQRGITKTVKGTPYHNAEKRELTQEEYVRMAAQFMAQEFVLNGFLVNTAMAQLLLGDPAQVFKKDVEGTLTEYQKRLAGPIAPGKETEWKEKFYKTVILDTYEVALDYINSPLLREKYADVDVTDAQEFVTMQEHLDVLFQYGMLDDQVYKEMSEIIIAGGDYRFTKPEHLAVVLQITKPVYYGKRPTLENGVLLHDYVKSSAMPLYPGYTAGTEIDKLRRNMEANDIRRAQFVSAKKIGAGKSAPAFDKDGKYQGFDPEVHVQVLSRDGFRIQQEVPHDPEKSFIQLGSQANKLIIADLPESFELTIDGVKYDRNTIRKYKDDLKISMLEENFNDLSEELGVTITPGGFTAADPKKLMAKLLDEGQRKKYSANELAPLLHEIEGKPIAPIFFTSLSKPLQNLMMSLVDNAVKVKIQGKSYVQASSVGITKLKEGFGNLQGITWMPGYDGTRELRMPEQVEGVEQTQPAEILVPFHFIVNGKKRSITEFMTDGAIDPNKLDPAVLEMVGIRIPTSKHNTMLPMKIVGFLPENMGDTIIVPPGITKQMGSDFDVDKLFVYQRPYQEVEGQLVPITDTTAAKYFDLHYRILTHPSVYTMMMTPLDKPDLKEEAKLVKTPEDTGNFFTPTRQLADFISQKDAKRLVGFGALTNVFLAGIQDLDLRIGTLVYNEETEAYDQQDIPVKLFATEYSGTDQDGKPRPLELVRLSGYGNSWYGPDAEMRTKMDNVNILLQEFLDHAKHRTIDKLNITIHTYAAAAALVSLEDDAGRSLNVSYAARMTTQPIIRKFNTMMERGNDMLSGYTPNLKESTIENLRKELFAAGADAKAAGELVLTAEQLLNLANNPKNTPEYATAQLAILNAFEYLDKIGTRMSEISSMLNQDVNGTNGNLFTVMDKIGKRANVLADDVILNAAQIMYRMEETEEGEDYVSTEKGWLFNKVNGFALHAYAPYLPHNYIATNVLDVIQKLSGRKSSVQLSDEVRNSVVKGIQSYTFSGAAVYALGVENIQAERARLLYTTPQSGPSLAMRVMEAKNTTWGKDNYLLQRLNPDLGDGIEPQSVTFVAAKVTRSDDSSNVKAWLDLLMSKDPQQRMLGEDLVRYAFLTGGVQDSGSFVRYVPFGYLLSTNWFQYLRDVHESMTDPLGSMLEGRPEYIGKQFIEQWFRHNPEQAISMSENFTDTGAEIEGVPESFSFTWPDPENETETDRKYQVVIGKERMYTPYISYRTEDGDIVLYKRSEPLSNPGEKITYVRMDTLGNETTDEYTMDNPVARSIITDNRTLNRVWALGAAPGKNDLDRGKVIGDSLKPAAVDIVPKFYQDAWGVNKPTLNYEDINDVLTHVQTIPEMPGVYHEMANIMQNLMVTQGSVFNQFHDAMQNGELQVEIGGTETPHYSTSVNTIRFPEDLTNHAYLRNTVRLTEIFLHEMTHWATVPFIQYAMQNQGYAIPELQGAFDKIKVAGNEKVIRASHAVVDLWKYLKVTHPELKSEWWMKDPHELVAYGMTHPDAMRKLNSLAYKGRKTVLQELWDLLTNLFDAIGELMGMKVDPGSVLAELLRNSTVILTHNNSIEVLDTRVVEYMGQNVTIGVDSTGKPVKVEDGFMHQHPEPRRQQHIRKVLALYTQEDQRTVDPVDPNPEIDDDFQEPSIDKMEANIRAISSTIADGSLGPWTYRNPVEAQAAADLAAQLAKTTTKVEGNTLTLYAAVADDDPSKKKLSPEIQNMVDRLVQQKKDVQKSIKGKEDPRLRAEKRLQLKKIEDDIELVRSVGKLHAIAEVGNRQIKWVRKIATDPAAQNPNDIMMAWRVTAVWKNMIDVLYPKGATGDIDPNLSKVATDSQNLQNKLLDKMKQAIIATSDGAVTLADFNSALKDMNGFDAYALSVNRSSSQLGQAWDLLLKNAGRRKETDIKKVRNQLLKMEKRMEEVAKAEGISVKELQELMIQGNDPSHFGLVQRYSVEWYQKRGELRGQRDTKIDRILNSKRVVSKEQRAKMVRKAWETYWKEMDKVGVYANVLGLFTEEGNYLPDITAERNRLIGETGSENAADALIAAARERYLQYLEQRDAYFNQVDIKFNEGTMTATEAQEEKDAYERRYSPRLFMRNYTSKNITDINQGDRFTVLSPKASTPEFFDAKYERIQKSEGLKAIYDEYAKLIKEMRSYLPLYVQWDMHDNFLPAVESNLITDMSFKEYLRTMGKRGVELFTATKWEEERKRANNIPIRFVSREAGKEETLSRDLIRIAEMFSNMAIHYRHFSAVQDSVDMYETIMKEIHIRRQEGVANGEVLTNTLKAMDYAKEYLMYQKPRAIEGDTGLTVYSANPLVQRKIAKKVKELMARKVELEKEYVDEDSTRSLAVIKQDIKDIDTELTKYADMGRNVYMSKVGDMLIGINQLKALAFNPFSGFANLAFGMISLGVYANGNRDFNTKQAMQAMGMMTNATKKYFTFGRSQGTVARKILALMEHTGIMGDVVDTNYGDTNLDSRKPKWKKNIDPYTFLRSSDYYMKGSVLIATMLGTNVTVTDSGGATKEISLWEAFDEEGNWMYPDTPGWRNEDSSQEPEWEKFRNRAIRISQIVMGNMDRNSPKLLNKTVIGRLIGQFRASWLPEGWAVRFEDEKFDQQLGRKIKGRYRTYRDIGLSGSATVLLRQFLGWFTGSKNYFDGIVLDSNGELLVDSEVDMENMRRNFTGMMWTLSMMAAALILKSLIPDDDDDDSFVAEALTITLNLMNRVNQDLQFYASPDVANSLIRNTIPAFDVVNDYIRAVKATEKAMRSEDYDWDQAALKWTKATPYLNQINRFRYMSTHDISELSR